MAAADQAPTGGRSKLADLFGIDLRALAALRIGVAVLVLADLVLRVPFLAAHYSDDGVLPRTALRGMSVYALSGSPVFAGMLFAAAGVLALMLLVGYHTWVATALGWFLLFSVQTRNEILNNSGDHLLSLLLFWGMFLPLGARASIDSRISPPRSPLPPAIVCFGGAGLMLQVMYPYVFSALLKNYDVWVTEGLAIYNALSLDAYARPAGRALLDYPVLVRWMSPLTYFFEMFGPFLAFVPFATAWFRTITALLFIGFHASLAVTFDLNLFAYVCGVMWLVFLPGPVWDALARNSPLAALSRAGGAMLDRLAAILRPAVHAQPWLAPPPDDGRATPAGNLVAGVALVYLLAWNIGTVYAPAKMPAALQWPGTQLYIGQKWEMFATPAIDDGWWVVPAVLHDGSEVDLFRDGAPVRWDKPESVLDTFPSERWRKMLEQIWNRSEHRPKAPLYAAWCRREWDAANPPERRIESMRVVYVLELTRPDYKPPIVSQQTIYAWSSSGEEFTPTLQDTIRTLASDLGAHNDDKLYDDLVRSFGAKGRRVNDAGSANPAPE